MVSVLFVCLGNICRSPMAEAILRYQVRQANLEADIQIDSAGTYDGHVGKPPHQGTRKQLNQAKIPTTGIVSRVIKPTDFFSFDYLIAMDHENIATLKQLANGNDHHIYSFVNFIPNTNYSYVPDPYYTGDFEETFQLVNEGCKYILDYIREKHKL
ncbi:protein-tyrosine phosphatase [Seinonella peptonophila]|uniref:protein-tyrosine-phosphatase n=1 Tax=Seinonella peptonophila TaxID=112248 RepID=A0A1M4TT16_9BACL|nr:low molecular weight protein-tyrosine-phosphatase [Seinonella peptonophila]SHE47546.1 protein-tyrosine phosphatase [Seinonella peptonophila]